MWTILKALALRMVVGRTLGGMLGTLFLLIVPIAGVLKVVGIPILIVLGIFLFGQFVEGNVLAPKLVGESVGLHPVWLMFALFAFGYLFGFVGLLLAVPLAAAFGVLARFALRRYMESSFYTGEPATGPVGFTPAKRGAPDQTS